MRFSIAFIFVYAASAAITNVQVIGVTNQQAIITYTAPDVNPCTMEVSESPSYSPLVHDVDTAYFAGSNSDFRLGNIVTSHLRYFIVGRRDAEIDLNGFHTSRSLQNFTAHYFRITCTGGVQATGTFTTDHLKLGNSYNENPPPDPTSPTRSYYTPLGTYAWPDFTKWDQVGDPTSRAEPLIDPQTGTLLKRLGMPGDQGDGNSPIGTRSFTTTYPATNWVNPNNVLVDDGNSATYSAATSDFLYVKDNNFSPGGQDGGVGPDILNDFSQPIESVTLSLKAWCSVGSCTSPNATIQVYITKNGVTPWPSAGAAIVQEIILGTTPNPSTFTTAGTSQAILKSWVPPGYQIPNRGFFSKRVGLADVSIAGNVTWKTGGGTNNYFDPDATAGSHIILNGQDCLINTTSGSTALTINTSSCSLSLPLTNTPFVEANFGFLIRKKTSSLDQINIQFAEYTTTSSARMTWNASGSATICGSSLAQNSVTLDLGYYCVIPSNVPLIYWVDHTTGTANFLGQFHYNGTGGVPDGFNSGFCGTDSVTLSSSSPTIPQVFYCTSQDKSTPTPKNIILSCTLTSTNQPGSYNTDFCTNITPSSTGSNLDALVQSFTASDTPHMIPSKYSCFIKGSQGSKLVVQCGSLDSGGNVHSQDTMGWVALFDPNASGSSPGCVTGGPGCIVAAMASWAHAPCRWCTLHTVFVSGNTTQVWVAMKFYQDQGSPGDGPYLSTITSSPLTSTPSIAAGTGVCPAGSYGCDQVTVDGEPCDETPVTGEASAPNVCPKNSAWVYQQNAAVGDVFALDNEAMLLVAKSGNLWTLQRAYQGPASGISPPVSHSNLNLAAQCASRLWNVGQSNDSSVWDTVLDPHGTGTGFTIAYDYDHVNPRTDVTSGGSPSFDGGCIGTCYSVRDNVGTMGAAPNKYLALSPPFSGTNGPAIFIEKSQDHNSFLQANAPASEKKWIMDDRPLVPGSELCDLATNVSGQLYKFTSTTSNGDTLISPGGAGASFGRIDRKIQQTQVTCGAQNMIDISSSATGNVISDTTADNYHYCVARKAGECRVGSAQGDIYLNCPNATKRGDGTFGCTSAFLNNDTQVDMCVTNGSAYLNGVIQAGFQQTDFLGIFGRTLTQSLSRSRLNANNDANAKAFSDGSWAMFPSYWVGGVWTDNLLVKLPPTPPIDSIRRSDFDPIKITLNPAASLLVNNAIIRFGYLENGQPTDLFCTTRRETCIATNSVSPFAFASDGSGGLESGVTGVPCSSGCTVTIPAIGQRIVYYQVVYRDVSNNIIGSPLPVEVRVSQ